MGKAASHSDVTTQVTGHPLTTASGPRRLTPQGPRPHGADRRSTAPGGTQLALPKIQGNPRGALFPSGPHRWGPRSHSPRCLAPGCVLTLFMMSSSQRSRWTALPIFRSWILSTSSMGRQAATL